ncbi:MAG: lysylphosphatidylglycerol synthase transmembrane domain-containing protein [Thermoleophilia bacterium]
MQSLLHPLNSTLDRFLALDTRWLAVAVIFQAAILVFRSSAWRAVLRQAYPRTRISLKDVVASYAAGVALNDYTPARAGEVLKVALLRMRLSGSSLPALAASSSVILAFDLVVGVALTVAAWAFGVMPALPQLSLTTGLVALSIVAAGVAALAASPRLRARIREGGAILEHPGTYMRRVVPAQLGAWVCRTGVAFALLAAFGLPATFMLAGLVVIATSVSSLAPTPGGAGAQQVLVVYVLQHAAAASVALSFSIGMQVGLTAMNTMIGIAGLIVVFGTFRPAVIRAGLRAAREKDDDSRLSVELFSQVHRHAG